jgi:predicted nuclease of restriction endonuclease-like (RecB) superfamily
MCHFLTMEDHFHEREVEAGLLSHIENVLLQLGRGFAFFGRQYSATMKASSLPQYQQALTKF